MTAVGVRELKQRASELLRRVQETGDTIEITRRGKVIARIVPAPLAENGLLTEERERLEQLWARMDELSADLALRWPQDVSAVDAVREQRREL